MRYFSGLLILKLIFFLFKNTVNPTAVIKTKIYTGIITDKIQNKIGENILKWDILHLIVINSKEKRNPREIITKDVAFHICKRSSCSTWLCLTKKDAVVAINRVNIVTISSIFGVYWMYRRCKMKMELKEWSKNEIYWWGI